MAQLLLPIASADPESTYLEDPVDHVQRVSTRALQAALIALPVPPILTPALELLNVLLVPQLRTLIPVLLHVHNVQPVNTDLQEAGVADLAQQIITRAAQDGDLALVVPVGLITPAMAPLLPVPADHVQLENTDVGPVEVAVIAH